MKITRTGREWSTTMGYDLPIAVNEGVEGADELEENLTNQLPGALPGLDPDYTYDDEGSEEYTVELTEDEWNRLVELSPVLKERT